jgi:hypothetical protein
LLRSSILRSDRPSVALSSCCSACSASASSITYYRARSSPAS